MEFKKYQHIERLGTGEVQDILFGKCYVFYKIDGTNASVWLDDEGNIKGGSRNRCLTLENDNAGFYASIKDNKNILDYLNEHPTHRLYGEWLVPHSLRTYNSDAWRKFYIFDVVKNIESDVDDVQRTMEYLPYEIYQPMLEEFNLEYIPPIAIINNPSVESIYNCLDKTGQFLVEDGKGLGEGVVIKNYDYYSKYGRQTWAKVVRAEFKEKHTKIMGAPEVNTKEMIEIKIVNDFCTSAFIEKEYYKILNDNNNEWASKMIPQLIGRVYHELIVEESWNIIKKYKNPTINYKTLQGFVTRKIKDVKSDLFN